MGASGSQLPSGTWSPPPGEEDWQRGCYFTRQLDLIRHAQLRVKAEAEGGTLFCCYAGLLISALEGSHLH